MTGKKCLFQPFPSDGKDRRATDTSGEYSHAEEHCGRDGVRLPVVGLLAAWSRSSSGSDPALMVCLSFQGTLSKSEWEATSKSDGRRPCFL